MMLSREFWFSESGVIVRAIRTAAQTAIAAIGVGTTNLFTADLQNVLALSASAAILSVLMSIDRSTTPNGTLNEPQPATDTSAADYQPAVSVSYLAPTGCGGDLR